MTATFYFSILGSRNNNLPNYGNEGVIIHRLENYFQRDILSRLFFSFAFSGSNASVDYKISNPTEHERIVENYLIDSETKIDD